MPWCRERARRWFAEPFHPAHPVPRTIGREAEFPIVDARTGELFPFVAVMPRLLDRLTGPGVEAIVDEYEGEPRLCGMRTDRWACFLEGGRGTVEVNAGPASSAFELADIMNPVIAALQEVADAEGAALLGYGIQPQTTAERTTILPRERYLTLAEAIGEDAFAVWSVAAADQAHVAVSRDEAVTAVNALHAATPFVIALTANSSVFGGRAQPVTSGR